MRNIGVAITLNLFYFDKQAQKDRKASPVTATTPIVRGVRISDVKVEGAKTAGDIIGLPEMPMDEITLQNVRVTSGTGMTVQDAKGVEMQNVSIVPQKGQPLTIINAQVKTR